METLFGLGSPVVASIWALTMVIYIWWLGYHVVRRRAVTLLTSLVFFGFFLPVLLQYPFTFSPINGLTIGPQNYANYRPHIDAAFLISMAGMVALVVGYIACGSKSSRFLPLAFVSAGLRTWTQSVFLYLSSVFILLLFALLFGLGLLGAGGARNIAQSSPALRPFYNVAHILLPLIIGLDLLVGLQRGRRVILFLAIANIGFGALTGARAVALGGLLLFALALLAHASLLDGLKLTKALKMVPVAMAVLIAAVYLADVREGQYNIALTIATLGGKLFYGNNFSDLRDFAWVLSYWNGEYLVGNTHVAGLMAFIPSAISSFRGEWNWGVVTTSIVGLDSRVHPGLRTGTFGETYFNFGAIGVVLAGLVYGYMVRRLHNASLAAARTLPRYEALLEIFAAFVTLNLIGSFLNTAGFFGFYLTVGVLAGLQLLDYMLRTDRAGPARVLSSGVNHVSSA